MFVNYIVNISIFILLYLFILMKINIKLHFKFIFIKTNSERLCEFNKGILLYPKKSFFFNIYIFILVVIIFINFKSTIFCDDFSFKDIMEALLKVDISIYSLYI